MLGWLASERSTHPNPNAGTTALLNFLGGCWGMELRSSYLHSKCSFPWKHCSSLLSDHQDSSTISITFHPHRWTQSEQKPPTLPSLKVVIQRDVDHLLHFAPSAFELAGFLLQDGFLSCFLIWLINPAVVIVSTSSCTGNLSSLRDQVSIRAFHCTNRARKGAWQRCS